jgi:hypothetical protein
MYDIPINYIIFSECVENFTTKNYFLKQFSFGCGEKVENLFGIFLIKWAGMF